MWSSSEAPRGKPRGILQRTSQINFERRLKMKSGFDSDR